MVETMKRNERERAYREIQQIIAAERDVMLQQEREKLALEKNAMRQAEEILAENQRKIEVFTQTFLLSFICIGTASFGIRSKAKG